MDVETLRARQGPLKEKYRQDPGSGLVILAAEGELRPAAQQCAIVGRAGPVVAGLHAATGGDGRSACSAEMLLEALVACAGVTLGAVATSFGTPVRGGRIRAEGTWDARGTLGVSREAPVGLTEIRLAVTLDTDAADADLAKLLATTERYCVVLQTLRGGTLVSATIARGVVAARRSS